MTKGLSSFPEQNRLAIATRRLNGNSRGMGFWAAKSYFDKFGMRYPGKLGAEQQAMQAISNAMANLKVDGAVAGFHMPDDAQRGGKLPRRAPRKNFGPNKNFKPHQNKMRIAR